MTWTLSNPYCSLADLKAALRITDTVDDDRLRRNINAASRQIENFTGRRFWVDGSVSARLFVASTPFLVELDDFQTTAGLIVQTDPNGDGTFPTTWASTDYQLEPVNAQYSGQQWAYDKIRAVGSQTFPIYGGAAYPNPNTQALVKVTAKWGWTEVPADVAQACIFQASMLFKMEDVPLGATPFNETGVITMKPTLHPGAIALLTDYDSQSVLVG